MTYVVGLTGGIGSGKSAVADAFAALGVSITDSDRLAHLLTAPGKPGYLAILAAFGREYALPDGSLNRAALRKLVFENDLARRQLEAILHPLIREAARREMDAWTSPYGLHVVPLLFERGGNAAVDRVLVVDCPEDEQIRRVSARSGLSEAEVRAIMATQLSRVERLARADDVLDNAGPLTAIDEKVSALHARYLNLAASAAKNSAADA